LAQHGKHDKYFLCDYSFKLVYVLLVYTMTTETCIVQPCKY